MKRNVIITLLVVFSAFLALYIYNKVASEDNRPDMFVEVQSGQFEISVTATGELTAEKSVDIVAPEFSTGRDFHGTSIKIQDLIPEGTIVKEGDFVATLDRTEFNNMLKDESERLKTMKSALEMKLLDSAVVLNDLRDGIKNQKFRIEEAALTLHNSKYEPPTTIRQAEIELDKSQRVLEQLSRSYTRRSAQIRTDIYNQEYWISRISKRVADLEEVLAGFTVKAPASGMIIYKKEWHGAKRKVGSSINTMDRVVATLPDLSSMLSKTFVSEIDVSKVKAGQEVNITVDAFPTKAYTGNILSVGNIGEKLPNTADKVFEVLIRLEGSDPQLRPSMTTGNKIKIRAYDSVEFVPIESVQAGIDSIPFVYKKNGIKQVVILGESNDKNVIIEKGLEPGNMLYLGNPENPGKFKLSGEEFIPLLKERKRSGNTVP